MSGAVVVDFFKTECQTGAHTDAEFGISESPQGGYVDSLSPDGWIAKIGNPHQLEVMFTNIDGCVLPKDTEPKRCDVMLTTQRSLHLIELKDQRSPGWVNHAIEQIASTIELLQVANQVTRFNVCRAHICNKKRPYAHESRRDKSTEFRKMFGFHLDVMVQVHITE